MLVLYFLDGLSVTKYDSSKYTIPSNWCENHWCYRDHAKELERPGTTNYGASLTFVVTLAFVILIVHYVLLVYFFTDIITMIKKRSKTGIKP